MSPGTDALSLPDRAALAAARARLDGVARRTPLQRSDWLSERAGTDIFLKLECWQRTHSFKLRGACNAVAALDAATRRRGLITASAGNHGLGLAHAARLHDATATIFVPTRAPAAKKSRIIRAGAELREVEGSYDDAAAAARAFAERTGAHFVHPFDDPEVVAGQGTVGLEIAADLPDVREVIVPVGGGGLVAGVAAALRVHAPEARAVGVQSTATSAMHDAFEAGHVVPTRHEPTLCDGLAGETEPTSYDRVRSVLDTVHLVPEDAVAPAIAALFREEGIVAEGAGAVGIAALLRRVVRPRGPAVAIVSGGNIDGERLGRILMES